jgi:hypothetical protein
VIWAGKIATQNSSHLFPVIASRREHNREGRMGFRKHYGSRTQNSLR